MSLRKKILITVLACVLMITLSAVVGFQIVLRQYTRSLYTQSAGLNTLYLTLLSDEVHGLTATSGSLATQPAVQSCLRQDERDSAVQDEARRFLGQSITDRITGIFLYDCREMRLALGNTGVNRTVLTEFVDRVRASSGVCWTTAATRDGSLLLGRRVLSAQTNSFMQDLGVLILRVNISRVLMPSTQYTLPGTGDWMITLFHNETLVYPMERPDSTIQALSILQPGAYSILTMDDQSYFVTMNTLDAGDGVWRLYIGLPYSEILGRIRVSRWLMAAFTLLASLVAFAVTALIVHRFTKNYSLLVSKMERFKRGEYHPSMISSRNTGDELTRLNRTFDEMAVSYERMTRENYEKQLLLMQAQLKNLEQQLDPHFLFNTLETINYFARRSGDENIPQIVHALAELLQYSLRGKNDCVPLEQEISMLKKYLYIQQMRFSDILSVEYDFSDPTLKTMIPKMTLQPLAENAIRYTLEEEETCRLRFSSRTDGDDVLIRISDNGPPMEEDLLEKLQSGERQAHGSGIGLRNVDTRHKLLFGEHYGLSFCSRDGWATVIVRVPGFRKGEGDPDVQNGTCG